MKYQKMQLMKIFVTQEFQIKKKSRDMIRFKGDYAMKEKKIMQTKTNTHNTY